MKPEAKTKNERNVQRTLHQGYLTDIVEIFKFGIVSGPMATK